MRYRFIERERVHYPVRLLCGLLAVSRSSYYVWRGGYESPRTRDNRHLLGLIHAVYRRAKGRYGSPRIHQALREQGVAVGRHRVARLMQQAGLKARRRRRRFRATTQSRHAHPIAPNRLGRNFAANRPNEKWVADITYVPTREGWLYLAVVLDLYARRVVGWAMGRRMKEELPQAALHMALRQRRPPAGLMHHSDRGRQYTGRAYRGLLRQHRIRRSMSRKGNCWDNAPMESFIATLKTELIHRHDFHTRQEARQALFEYIEVFYNRQRTHSALGYKTPVQYEQQFESSIIVR